jgi:hypothetical protein
VANNCGFKEVRMNGFDPRWSDDVRGGGRHRDGGGVEIGREVPRGGSGTGGPEREAPDSRDPRDVFVNHVNLPRGRTREYVYSLREPFLLRGSESRALATAGAFRVVPASDLRDGDGRPLDPNRGELHHLRRQGLVEDGSLPWSRPFARGAHRPWTEAPRQQPTSGSRGGLASP